MQLQQLKHNTAFRLEGEFEGLYMSVIQVIGKPRLLDKIKDKYPHLIAGKAVDVLTANATKSVMVVMVTVAPVRDITSLMVLITPN